MQKYMYSYAKRQILFCVVYLPKRIYGDNEKNMIVKYVRMYCFIIVTLMSSPYIFLFSMFCTNCLQCKTVISSGTMIYCASLCGNNFELILETCFCISVLRCPVLKHGPRSLTF